MRKTEKSSVYPGHLLACFLTCVASGGAEAGEPTSPEAPPPDGAAQAAPESAAPETEEAASAADQKASPSTEAGEAARLESQDGAAEAAQKTYIEDSESAIRLRSLEEQVNGIKEKIFKSKARLMLLRETVLSGAISGAKAVITHHNTMGSSFVLEEVSYSLDGAPLFSKTPEEGGKVGNEVELFNGSIVPGNHNISVFMRFRGAGFGIFSYVEGYEFKLRSSYAFTAEEGKVTSLSITAFEKGGFTTDLQDRPNIRYDVEVRQDSMPMTMDE